MISISFRKLNRNDSALACYIWFYNNLDNKPLNTIDQMITDERKIKIVLKKMFRSIDYVYSTRDSEFFNHFVLKDTADHAAFLLWSNTGVEI